VWGGPARRAAMWSFIIFFVFVFCILVCAIGDYVFRLFSSSLVMLVGVIRGSHE
jgi:hypothetical protein